MPRVLIVEDEDTLRHIFKLILTRRGYQVTEAEDAAEASALCTTGEPFDLLLLDINLPDQTGWDVLRSLELACASQAPGSTKSLCIPPVIVVTAIPPTPGRLHEFHPFAVLIKPFPIEALIRLIERVFATAPDLGTEEWADQADQEEVSARRAPSEKSLPAQSALPKV